VLFVAHKKYSMKPSKKPVYGIVRDLSARRHNCYERFSRISEL